MFWKFSQSIISFKTHFFNLISFNIDVFYLYFVEFNLEILSCNYYIKKITFSRQRIKLLNFCRNVSFFSENFIIKVCFSEYGCSIFSLESERFFAYDICCEKSTIQTFGINDFVLVTPHLARWNCPRAISSCSLRLINITIYPARFFFWVVAFCGSTCRIKFHTSNFIIFTLRFIRIDYFSVISM